MLALTGVRAASIVSDDWGCGSQERDDQPGTLLAYPAQGLGLSLQGQLREADGCEAVVGHFEGKGEVEEYFWDIGVPGTSMQLVCCFKNPFSLCPRKPQKERPC